MEFYYQPFKNFHPITGKVPDVLTDEFEYIAKKARQILKGRKRKEIDYAMKTVNWIMLMAYKESPSIQLENQMMEEIKNPKSKKKFKSTKYFNNYESPALMLLNTIGKYDISEQYDFPNAVHAEYFSVLSLAIIDVACYPRVNVEIKARIGVLEAGIHELKSLSHLAINAMQAISFAEMYYSNNIDKTVTQKAEELISLKKSAAAIKGNQPKYTIKQLFLEFHDFNDFKTDIKAIKEFMKTLTAKQLKKVPDNWELFFRKALRESRKN